MCSYNYRMNTSPGLLATTQCLCLASRRAARAITRAFDRELRAHGLRATQFTLLAALSIKGEQTVGDIADFVDADRTTMTRNVALAHQAGLVKVRRSDADARVRLVAITSTGGDRLTAALATWSRVQAGLTSTMGSDVADGLRRLAAIGLTKKLGQASSAASANIVGAA